MQMYLIIWQWNCIYFPKNTFLRSAKRFIKELKSLRGIQNFLFFYDSYPCRNILLISCKHLYYVANEKNKKAQKSVNAKQGSGTP